MSELIVQKRHRFVVLRREKVDALKKEIEILAQNHECEVDRKDSIIQMLTRDLDECEEQYVAT